jgi:hypothetical protein
VGRAQLSPRYPNKEIHMAKQSPYLKLEKSIAADERGGIMHRWRYGRELLKAKAGRKQLPHGLITELMVEALRAGLKLTEREIQYRIKCATVYDSEAKVRTACADFGSWSALRDAGFPAVEVDEEDQIDGMEEVGISTPDVVEMPLFDIPGFKPVLRINGKKVDLADATVGQAVDYRDMCREMHANFGRTVAQVEATVAVMIAGCGGDLDVNALDAWRRGTEDEAV